MNKMQTQGCTKILYSAAANTTKIANNEEKTSSNDNFSRFFQVCLKRCVFPGFPDQKFNSRFFLVFPGAGQPVKLNKGT